MKRKILVLLSVITCLVVALWPNQSAHSNGGGAPAGYTGSPNEFSGRTCSAGGSCHSGGATAQTGWVTSTVPACGYTPGQTYSVTVFVTSPGRTKFGFSASPQKANATQAGTLIAGTGMQLNGSGKYITHTSAGTTQTGTNSRTWTFQWTAPAAGTGTVTFYAAMNATNSSNSSAGDMIYSSNLVLAEAPTTLSINNSGGTSYCQSSPVTLTSNISGGNAWTKDGNPIGTQNSVVASGSGTYELTNTTGACVQTASVTLTAVAGAPVVSDIQIGSQGIDLCSGQSTTLTATGSGVTWLPGGQTTNTITVSTAGTYSYSLTNVCGTSTSNSVGVTVTPLPTTPVIQTPDGLSVCPSSSIQLTAVSSNNVVWSPGGETTASIQVSTGGTYSVVSNNSCGSSSPIQVTVEELSLPETPEITTAGDITEACEGSTITLTAANIGSNQALWLPGDGTNSTFEASQSGTYSVTYTNVCGTSESTDIDLTFNPLPETPSIFLNTDLDLEATIDASFYEWYLNGTLIDGENDQVLTPSGVGFYTVKAISGDDCVSELSVAFEVTALGLTNISGTNIRIFPNPSEGNIQLTGITKQTSFQVYDATGKSVKSFVVSANSQQSIELNLPSGLYFIRCENWNSTLVVE